MLLIHSSNDREVARGMRWIASHKRERSLKISVLVAEGRKTNVWAANEAARMRVNIGAEGMFELANHAEMATSKSGRFLVRSYRSLKSLPRLTNIGHR